MRNPTNRDRSIYNAVLKYLGNRCVYCGSTKNLEIHHIIPLYLGGKNDLGNMEVVCKKCHLQIHEQIKKLFPPKPVILKCSVCGAEIERKIQIKNPICDVCRNKKKEERKKRNRKENPLIRKKYNKYQREYRKHRK